MSDPTDLVAWLSAQIDEDERAASDPNWRKRPHGPGCAIDADHAPECDCDYAGRVLREVEAKRRIMAIHRRRADVFAESGGAFDDCCDGCGYGGICDDPNIEDINDCPELRVLGAIYIDRPGYRSEWAP